MNVEVWNARAGTDATKDDAFSSIANALTRYADHDEVGTSDDVLGRQFRRGIGYLAAPPSIRSIGDLIRLAVEERAVKTWHFRTIAGR
jgi:hypothetical protein